VAIEHNVITDPEIHEPKGIAAASTGELYVADGGGSGSWSKPLDIITASIVDISTAGSTFIVSPYAGTITKIYSVIDGAIATADASLTFEIAGTPVTGGTITVAITGSAAGSVDSATPSAANSVIAGQAIEIITDGASTNTVKATVSFIIQRT